MRPDPARVLILQSHRQPLPAGWIGECMASVRHWAEARGYHYRFEGDNLFDRLSDGLRARTAAQPVAAADLARLAALDEALRLGYRTAVWMDADSLMIDPAAFELPDAPYALGREVWIQNERGRLRPFVKVHNAFLLFRAGNPFLTFYRHAAERIVARHIGPMAPQLVGPKLLSALHNLVDCPVAERAAVLSPAVVVDLLAGGGPALAMLLAHSREPPAVVNLCGSLVGRDLSERQVRDVMKLLRAQPRLLG
jgi:hypothetical protein